MFYIRRSTSRNCSKNFVIFCILFLIICLIINEKFFTNKKISQIKQINNNNNNTKSNNSSIINRIKSLPILHQKYEFNITYQIKIDDIPKWIYQYKISHLFNFYWLQTGGYKWHLQQMMDLKHVSKNRQLYFYNQTSLFNDLYHHLEYGIIIDTASDPFKPIFSPLPRTSSSLYQTCLQLAILDTWYPCYTKSENISPIDFKPLITYGLYNVIIGSSSSSSSERIHYDEIIYLFDNQYKKLNETYYIRQILPKIYSFIRSCATNINYIITIFSFKNKIC